MKVLLTGGAGYIGSTTASALEDAGHTPVILDSLLTGPREFVGDRFFYEGDVADRDLLRRVFADHPDIACTVHLAARTIVPESVAEPSLYYRDNVAKSVELLDELVRLGRPRVVFSSSASLYGLPAAGFEVDENSRLDPQSPYARSKLMVEMALQDLAEASDLRAIVLRYFNPIGSDPALRSGVYASEPTHVLGQLLLTAMGHRRAFRLTGTDLPTRDGTGIRDYVHVWDVALAHVAAVERFDDVLEAAGTRSVVLNIGTGRGVTVRELLHSVVRVTDRPIEVLEAPSRPGDAVGTFANVDRSHALLGWRARSTLEEAITSALAWASKRHQVLGRP